MAGAHCVTARGGEECPLVDVHYIFGLICEQIRILLEYIQPDRMPLKQHTTCSFCTRLPLKQ